MRGRILAWPFSFGAVSIPGRAVAVERKSLADFVHTVVHAWPRFSRELITLSTYDAACIVVEADLDAVLRNECEKHLRQVSPLTLLGAATFIRLFSVAPRLIPLVKEAVRRATAVSKPAVLESQAEENPAELRG